MAGLSERSAQLSQIDVNLVPHSTRHLAATFFWLAQNPCLRKQIDSLEPPSSQAANAECWKRRWADPTRADFAIIADGLHVGNCGLIDIDRRRRKAQLWIYVSNGKGQGYGTLAVRRLLDFAFLEQQLQRVYIRVLANNLGAVAFYERLGFVHEGLLRQDTIHNGTGIDSHAMAILAKDYGVGAQ